MMKVMGGVVAVAGLLALGLMLAVGALALGGDRVVPCDSREGLDALLGEEGGHVDGPDGGGGCIVPTAGSWTAAIVVSLAPSVAFGGLIFTRRQSHEVGERAE